MNNDCVVLCSTGMDPYDHAREIKYETHVGSFEGDDNRHRRDYLAHFENLAKKGVIGWVTLWELNVKTGTTKCWLNLSNPLKKRIEINIPAKQAKSVVKRTQAYGLGAPDVWTTSFGSTLTAGDAQSQLDQLVANLSSSSTA